MMPTKTDWKPVTMALVIVACGSGFGETTSFAQGNTPVVSQERDQRYLIYVKGIT